MIFVDLKDQFRYFVGGYYGVSLMDEYPLKEFILKDIQEFLTNFIECNPIDSFSYLEEAEKIKDEVSDRVKLQDALLVLQKIQGPMDLVFLIQKRLKKK